MRRVLEGRCVVTAADGSTGGFGSHCCSLWRVDEPWLGGSWPGKVRLGGVWSGLVWLGAARTADGSTEGSPSLLFSREQVWSGPASRGPLG